MYDDDMTILLLQDVFYQMDVLVVTAGVEVGSYDDDDDDNNYSIDNNKR